MHIFLREDRRDDLNGLFESSKACVKVATIASAKSQEFLSGENKSNRG